jgi:hypothetical protein
MARTIFYFLSILLIFISCSSQRKSQSLSLNNTFASSKNIEPLSDQKTADGSSFEKAIFIDKTSEKAGIDAEYAWLKENYPGYRMIQQSLSQHKGRSYDILKIKTKESEEKDIHFDISKFFGKW